MARIDKINEEVRVRLSELLRSVKDPRLGDALISITRADVTPDLKQAKIYVSVLGGDVNEVVKGLKSASGFLRRELAHSIELRATPELLFVRDDSITRGTQVLDLLRSVDIKPEVDDADGE